MEEFVFKLVKVVQDLDKKVFEDAGEIIREKKRQQKEEKRKKMK